MIFLLIFSNHLHQSHSNQGFHDRREKKEKDIEQYILVQVLLRNTVFWTVIHQTDCRPGLDYSCFAGLLFFNVGKNV